MALVLITGEGNQKYITFLHVLFCVLEDGFLSGFFSEMENNWVMAEGGGDCASALGGDLQQRLGRGLEL